MKKTGLVLVVGLAALAAVAAGASAAEPEPSQTAPTEPPAPKPPRPVVTDPGGGDPFGRSYGPEDYADEDEFPPGLYERYRAALESRDTEEIFEVAEILLEEGFLAEGVTLFRYGEEVHEQETNRFATRDQLVEAGNAAVEAEDWDTVIDVADELERYGFEEEAEIFRDEIPAEADAPMPDTARQEARAELIAAGNAAAEVGDVQTVLDVADQLDELGFSGDAATFRNAVA